MTAQYDIFKKTPNNDFIWVEAVEDIGHARKRLIHLTANQPDTGFGTAAVKCSWNPWKIAPKGLVFSAFPMKMTALPFASLAFGKWSGRRLDFLGWPSDSSQVSLRQRRDCSKQDRFT